MVRPRAHILLLGVLLTVLSACGQSASKADKDPTPAKPAASDTPVGEQASPDPAAAHDSAADKRANLTILPVDQLPQNWTRVPPKDRIDGDPGKPTYCGVRAEPDDVKEGRISWYEEKSLGNAVLEFGLVATEASAKNTLDALLAKRDSCQEPGHKVTPVDVGALGEQSVGWDFVPDDGGTAFRAIVFRVMDTIVVLVAYGQTKLPDQPQREIGVAIAKRLQG